MPRLLHWAQHLGHISGCTDLLCKDGFLNKFSEGSEMSKRLRIALAAALAVGATLIGTLSPGVAQAGPAPEPANLTVTVNVNAPNPLEVLAALTPEFYPDGSDSPNTSCTAQPSNLGPGDFYGYTDYACPDVPAGSYQIGIDGAPPNAIISAYCNDPSQVDERIENGNTMFTFGSEDFVRCNIYVDVPAVFIDKVVVDGPAGVSDFDIEVYEDLDAEGGPDAGALVATANDTDPTSCHAADLADCAVVLLDPGSYQLGEIPASGYLATNVFCVPVFGGTIGERFPGTAGTFTLGGLDKFELSEEIAIQEPSLFAYCEIENTYFTGDIVVDKVVVNDDGGTATADDFTAEVFLKAGGAAVVEKPCAADGSCIDQSLAIGEYRVGESGPAGYSASVECAVTREPDTPVLGTVVPTLAPREVLSGDIGLFELEPFGAVTCTITNNDDPQPTTTTTTVAPTTTDQAQAPVLPATGGDSDSLGLIAALGAAMLLMGGTLLAARRRS
jgi:LPXTG-motif cell wall-anchored protein